MSGRSTFLLLCFTFMVFIRSFYCHPALQLDVTPAPGCTHDVGPHNISCTLEHSLTSIEKVTSLTILASRLYGEEGEFDPVVAIDLWTHGPQLLNGITTAEVNVLGKIGTAGEITSYIIFSWKTPRTKEIGRYRCVANGLDRSRRVVSISVTSIAETSKPRPDRPLQNSLLEGMANTTADFGEKILNLDAKVDALQDNVQNVQEMVLAQNFTIVEIYRSIFLLSNFVSSDVFNGKRYHISKFVAPFDFQAADAKCAIIGGHLVEIGKKDEFDFVFAFSAHVGGTEHFFTSANDIDREDEWTFWHSKLPVSFFNWAVLQPDNFNDEDCMEINVRLQGFNDFPCHFGGKFICEVEI